MSTGKTVDQRREAFDCVNYVIVWVVNERSPYSKVKPLPANIEGEADWAMLANGKRKKLGATAFLTEAAALENQIARCVKIVEQTKHLPHWHLGAKAGMAAHDFLRRTTKTA